MWEWGCPCLRIHPTHAPIHPTNPRNHYRAFGGDPKADLPPSLAEAASGSSSVFRLSLSKRGSFRRKPSMEEARAFGERRKPHRIPDPSQPCGYRLARVGEWEDETTGAKAEEYGLWSTPLSGLDSFGIGISLYFRQVGWVGVGIACGCAYM